MLCWSRERPTVSCSSFPENRIGPSFHVQWKLLNSDHGRRAVELAKNSDLVIFVGGITPQLEGEEMQVNYEGFKGGDRTNLNLPVVQEELLKELRATGTPVVLVLMSCSALAVNWENENLPAIVQLSYPGEEGARRWLTFCLETTILRGDCRLPSINLSTSCPLSKITT